MRFVTYIVLAITIAFIPFQTFAAGTVMGGFTCRQPLPCDQSDPAFPSSDRLMSIANTCVAQNTAFTPPTTGFFTSNDIDGNGCFQTNPGAFPGTDGLRSVPQCCIRQSAVGTCLIHCDMISR